jgi:general stress protein 26
MTVHAPRVEVENEGSQAMTKPDDKPLSPTEARQLALEVLRAARFPFLATADGNQPRLRPVSPVRTDGFTVYIANLRRYGKTLEIAANPHVELGYLDEHHNQVRITGVVEVVTDRALLQDIWEANPLLRQYLGHLDNPELIVYRVQPIRIRYMREWALDYHEVPVEGPS